jgi:phage protein D
MPENVAQFHIKVNGESLPAAMAQKLHSVTVESSLNLPSMAEVSIMDANLEFIDGNLLEPGKTLEILAKSGSGAEQKIFDGEIVELEPNFDYPNAYCVVRGFDRLHRLMRGQFVRDFPNSSDSDIASKIASEAGLSAKVKSTSPIHEYVFQDNETNLEFLQRRAAPLGYVIFADGKDLHFEPPNSSREVELKWGKDGLSTFRPRMTTLGQPTEITVLGWNPNDKQVVKGQASAGEGQPKIAEARDRVAMAQVYGKSTTLLSTTLSDEKQVQNLANGEANRRSGAFVEAEGVCGGHPGLMAGVKVKLDNIGDRFKGEYLVSNVTHIYDQQKKYHTQFTVSSTNASTISSMMASEDTPRLGLVVGIVTNNDDPKGWGRVKVKFPSLSEDKESDWARVVSVGGGKERGIEFLPEVNDEVLVGFFQGDRHVPFVMGGLHNGKDAPPKKTSEVVSGGKVERRIIRSRTGHIVILDDSSSSPGITIMDSKGNKIEIDTKTGSMILNAENSIEIKSKKITINGQTLVEIDGQAIKIG